MPNPGFDYEGTSLLEWKPVHATRFDLDASGSGVFMDVAGTDWHLIRLSNPEFLFTRLKIRLEVEPLTREVPYVYIHHYGGPDICKIAVDGSIVQEDAEAEVHVTVEGRRLIIDATFRNSHPALSIGSAREGGIYGGTGSEIFRIHRISVSILEDLQTAGRGWPMSDRIRLVDVGGAGGIQDKWLGFADCISPILFEPNPEQAAELQVLARKFPGGTVIEKALAHVHGPRSLNIAKFWGCTSVLEPNPEILSHYGIGPLFDVTRKVEVECVRYDTLHSAGLAPAPDVVKIDVQGFEYQVLLGFGGLLQSCLAVELEAHFYPIYRNQRLLHDLVDLLQGYGLVLKSLRQVPNFDGDAVEVDAVFGRRRSASGTSDPSTRRKLEVVSKVLGFE